MKKGDKVVIDDGSWTREIKDNKLVRGPGSDDDKQYVVIETGCKFPLYDGMSRQKDENRSDTVIQAVDSGEVVFIFEGFLRPVPPKHMVIIGAERKDCVVVGTWVEISDKLYQEIKRDSQS